MCACAGGARWGNFRPTGVESLPALEHTASGGGGSSSSMATNKSLSGVLLQAAGGALDVRIDLGRMGQKSRLGKCSGLPGHQQERTSAY